MALKLIIGNKNYSSWSLRPWIGLKVAGIPFEEEVISLYVAGGKEQILKHSPAGKVPILIDGDVSVWESLAILEYVAEKFPDLEYVDVGLKIHQFVRYNFLHPSFLLYRKKAA